MSRRLDPPTKPSSPETTCHRSDRRSNVSVDSSKSGTKSKAHSVEYESPTESTAASTLSLSSHPAEENMCTPGKDKSNDIETVRMDAMSEEDTPEPLSPFPENGAVIEVAKITALVEEELMSQRLKHREHLNRTVTKYKGRIESFQIEIDKVRAERDEAKRQLEESKRSLTSQKPAAERNDCFQSQQKDEIEVLEDQAELFAELQKERDVLLDEVSKTQLRQQNTKDELNALKLRVREDSQKRLSVMECLSASWDAEKKEAKQRETLLNSELEIMSKTLKAEQEYLKHKNKEFNMLEAQYRSTKVELKAMKKSLGGKKDDMEDDLRRDNQSRKRLSEEHKKVLKLKNEELKIAENTIASMKAQLKMARENFILKEESMSRSVEGMNHFNGDDETASAEIQMLREDNIRLDGEVKELHKQVESYLANMALQQEFCDSLKSRIYKEQQSEHEQIEEMHRLRKQLKKAQKESAEKDRRIDELKELLRESADSPIKVKVKSKSSSSRNVTGEKKSKTKKSKSASRHGRDCGYSTS